MNHSDYRVAWICPLAKERSAAVSLLDDIHPTLSPRDGDSNIYTYGRMGKHNVVIAHLPSGSSGNGHAARLAVRLKNTFRNIEFSFLVGIGGGAPSREHDIRLGDIVVSHPHRQSGGVIQYDHGKALPGNEIEITGSLNRPSDALLSAVAKLDSDYRCRDSRIMEILSESIEKNPRRLEACIYPGSTYEDRLFHSDYPHQKSDDPDCNWCDKRQSTPRPARYDFLKVDPTRRAILTRFDHWIGCQCKDNCGRRWNFANERGLCDGEEREGQGREECDMVKVWRERKVWGEKGKKGRWQKMKEVWYMS
ncbi:hypothetical protein KVT40_001489 [Elsinoe batatas]|uniref:Nucleoside phosphorylase domain-containing protein n=1 Tax=Elsinoe batatas TaxID=2601811 RepID=A0A8K0L6R0_9PEZI|nr:hypothetical protein KVT40_001489 [Elsinoe batatas]